MSKAVSSGRRVVILITQLERGGAQKIAIRLARHFSARGYVVTLCFFYDRGGLAAELEADGSFGSVDLRVRPPWGSPVKAWHLARALWRLYDLLRNPQADVVLTFTHFSNMLGMTVAWLAGVPLRIASIRSLLADRSPWLVTLHGIILNARVTQMIVAVSQHVRQRYVGSGMVKPDRIMVIHNGIDVGIYQEATPGDLRRDLQIPADARIILTVARLEQQKGHAVLLEAARRLLADDPQLIFLWAGDGPERAHLLEAVAAAGLKSSVRLLGARSDVPALLAAADLFAFPSLAEGLPNALLEALAAEVPVVATDAAGCVEVVTHGSSGLIVPAGDAGALADALGQLLRDGSLRRDLAARGLADVRTRFSERAMLDRYERLLEIRRPDA